MMALVKALACPCLVAWVLNGAWNGDKNISFVQEEMKNVWVLGVEGREYSVHKLQIFCCAEMESHDFRSEDNASRLL